MDRGLVTEVGEALALLRRVAAAVEPFEVIPEEAARLVADLGVAVRLATNALTIAVDRAGSASTWRQAGHGSVADWVAATSGIAFYDARRLVDASERLARDPGGILADLRAGRVTALAAAEVLTARDAAIEHERRRAERGAAEARAEAFGDPEPTAPSAPPGKTSKEIEADMLRLANERSLAEVRKAAEREKAAAADAEARRREQYRSRAWWEASNPNGSGGGGYRLPPHVAALVNAKVRAEAERQFQAARRTGVHHSREAYLADALCALLGVPPAVDPDAPSAPSPAPASAARTVQPVEADEAPLPELVVRLDAAAILRGEVVPGERCELHHTGPIALPDALSLLAHSHLFVVVHDDDGRVVSIADMGRRRPPDAPAHLRPDGDRPAVMTGVLRVRLADLAPARGATVVDLAGAGLCNQLLLERVLGPTLAARLEAKACDVHNVVFDSRRFPNVVRIAALEEQPLCVDCGNPFGLEGDHDQPHATGGPTSLANYRNRCRRDHRAKTVREAPKTVRAGLLRKRARAAVARASPAKVR